MKLLLVEDDEVLRSAMKYQLKKLQMTIDECSAGDEALYFLGQCEYDVIILDRMLPEVDGITILKRIREKQIHTPVIMVTAMGSVDHRIEGLEVGADDYLVKPFEMRELVARIHALSRRPSEYRLKNEVTLGKINLNLDTKVLKIKEKECELTVKEAELMEVFLKNQNQILTREVLINRVWGMDSYITESNLDNYIYFLRRRLKTLGDYIKIVTVRGIGYRMEEN